MALVGKGSFIVGLLIAVGGGLGFEQAWFGWVLAALGLIVGFLNISDKEYQAFLLSGHRADRMAAIGRYITSSGVHDCSRLDHLASFDQP